MTENSIDVNIVPVKNGMKRVVVSYYHYSRKEKDRMSSQTDYVWETKNEEMFKYFEARRTKELNFSGDLSLGGRFANFLKKRLYAESNL